MRFMIVEDEYWQRRTLRRFLDTIEETVLVGEFEDAGSAWSFFNDNADTVDIAIVDLVLPDYSGIRLTEQMKKRKPGLKLLCISGEENINALREGIFIAKPFRLDKFTKAIELIKNNQERSLADKTAIIEY